MFDRLISALLAVAALAIAAVLVRREVRGTDTPDLVTERLTRVEDFGRLVDQGATIGPRGAPVQIVEFGDFECPYCRRFHEAFDAVRKQYPSDVSLTFIHYPLSAHRFAKPAARASECAREQGKFDLFANSLFAVQDSLGLIAWMSIGARTGVDTTLFAACLRASEVDRLVEAGRRLGEQYAVQYTPTVMINGWRFALPPTETDLRAAIEAVRGGRQLPDAIRAAASRR